MTTKKPKAEVTVAQQLHQGTAQGMGCFHSLLEITFISTRKNYIG